MREYYIFHYYKNSLSYRLVRSYRYRLSQPISFLRYENGLFLVSVVADRHLKSIFKNKKILNPDPSPPGPDPGIQEGGHRQPHREKGGAIGRRCRSRLHHRGLPPAQIRAVVASTPRESTSPSPRSHSTPRESISPSPLPRRHGGDRCRGRGGGSRRAMEEVVE
jgi:hypothetical protein